MNDKKTISRRGFLSAMAVLGSIGIEACGTQSTKQVGLTTMERAAGKLPDRAPIGTPAERAVIRVGRRKK